MKQLLLQAFNLIRQNPFYATISIIGTAVTIAFVMVVVMIYDFRTMDMAPESDRSDMMYTGSGMTYRKLDHTNQNSGMGRKAFEALFSELPGVKEVTWYRGVSKTPCNLSASNEIFNYYVRPVADNWFKFFDYEFIAGRPFTQEEYDARRWVSVITERMALQLFGTTDVVGKEYQSNFFPTKVVGVVKDVNAIFQTAYADAFVPFSLENEDYYATWTGGLGGIRLGLLKLLPDTRPAEVRTAYGASRISIMVRLFLENLLTVFLGGILGYLFSCVLVWLGRVWLFGSGEVELSGISLDGGLLLHPALFVLVFGVCVVFNLLSVLIPVWMVTHRNIATTIKGE